MPKAKIPAIVSDKTIAVFMQLDNRLITTLLMVKQDLIFALLIPEKSV